MPARPHHPRPWSVEDAGDGKTHLLDAHGRYILDDSTADPATLIYIAQCVNAAPWDPPTAARTAAS